MECGVTVDNVDVSQLQGPRFHLELGSLSVQSFASSLCGFPPVSLVKTCQKVDWLYYKSPLGVMDWHFIRSVLMPRFWIHCSPAQDKVLTQDEWMIVFQYSLMYFFQHIMACRCKIKSCS